MDQAGYLQNLNSVIPGTDMTHRPDPESVVSVDDAPFNVIDSMVLSDESNADIPVLAPITGYEAHAVNFAWSYGPTATNSDPGRMWHEGCGKEVLFIDGAFVCECGAQGDHDGNRILSDSEKLDMVISQLTMIQAKQAKHDEAFVYLTGAMGWLTNMLGSVAQVAQSMPGMGGMVARMMGMGGGKNNG